MPHYEGRRRPQEGRAPPRQHHHQQPRINPEHHYPEPVARHPFPYQEYQNLPATVPYPYQPPPQNLRDESYEGLRAQIFDDAAHRWPRGFWEAWDWQRKVTRESDRRVFDIVIARDGPHGSCRAHLTMKRFYEDKKNEKRFNNHQIPNFWYQTAAFSGSEPDARSALENLLDLTMTWDTLKDVKPIHRGDLGQVGDREMRKGMVNRALH